MTAPAVWKVGQIFDDPARNHDWGNSAEVDIAASDETGGAVSGLVLSRVGYLGLNLAGGVLGAEVPAAAVVALLAGRSKPVGSVPD